MILIPSLITRLRLDWWAYKHLDILPLRAGFEGALYLLLGVVLTYRQKQWMPTV